jgi:hypothetical protein
LVSPTRSENGRFLFLGAIVDIEEILAKPGRQWTKEEAQYVRTKIKTSGRQALKSKRMEILQKQAGKKGGRAELLAIKKAKHDGLPDSGD